MKDLGIYIHIPFCASKCFYCDFFSMPSDEQTKEEYVNAVCKQIEYESAKYADNYNVISIFVGGGTPSILRTDLLCKILDCVDSHFNISKECEISVECNPGTVDYDKLAAYLEHGVNRISFGLQSTKDSELAAIGRIHTFKDFVKSYEFARQCGYNNINVDIMSALPNQTVESYRHTLRTVCALRPEHISSYSLILEENTKLYELVENNLATLLDEDTERELYYITGEELSRAGYERYEISNYARGNHRCIHNVNYWRRIEYLGIGAGASSLMCGTRYDIEKDIRKYINNPQECYINQNRLTLEDRMSEFMFLGLRMMEGINVNAFRTAFGRQIDNVYGKVIDKYVASGHLIREGDIIRLSNAGIDVSNYIFSDFI